MTHPLKTFTALLAVLLVAPLLLATVAAPAAPGAQPALVAGVALAETEPPAPVENGEEAPDVQTLWDLLQDAPTGPAAAGAFVAAALAYIRHRYGGPKGIMAVASVAVGSLAVGVGLALMGHLGESGTIAGGLAFGVKTFGAAIAERELLVNALRSISGSGGTPQSNASQDAARHRTTRRG